MKTIYTSLKMHALLVLPCLLLTPASHATICTTTSPGNWSAIHWSAGHIPGEKDSVIINHHVWLDVSTANLAYVQVSSGASLTINNGQTIRMNAPKSIFLIQSGGNTHGENSGANIVYPSPGNSISGPFDQNGLAVSDGGGSFDTPIPLSVKISSFSVTNEGAAAHLQWTAENERDNAYYEIERSFDGRIFSNVSIIPSSQSTDNKTYHYIDHEPAANTVYYRLKVVATNTTSTYTNIIRRVTATKNDFELSAYPNPTSRVLHYSSVADQKNVQLSLTDGTGRIIWSQVRSLTAGQQYELPLDQFINGAYYFSVKKNDGTSKTMLIHKQ